MVNKTATAITVNWTALDSSDADGYVVNVTSDTDTVQTVQVEGSSNNTITLNGLRVETTYNITVRAYQQLLGPASSTISIQTLPGILLMHAPVNVYYNFYSVPGLVGSVSSIMDTTWAVISWSVPSYIPQAYPIIRYEIGYHVLDNNCSMADADDINIQVLNHSNVFSDSTFINITGLSDNTCYIFGVRAGTVNGYGEWIVIANETLELPPQPSPFLTSTLANKTILNLPFTTTSNICVTPTHSGRVYFVILMNIAPV